MDPVQNALDAFPPLCVVHIDGFLNAKNELRSLISQRRPTKTDPAQSADPPTEKTRRTSAGKSAEARREKRIGLGHGAAAEDGDR
jgi:hypothetical protein